jgi:tRNA-dihydrouridine synthase B
VEHLTGSLDVPVTAKMRVLDSPELAVEVAKTIEKAGASAITVHGRTQKQGYSGKANLEIIRAINSAISIPVIANGDIRDEKTASHVLEYTRCDGLMLCRAAIYDMLAFNDLKLKAQRFLKNRENIKCVREHLNEAVDIDSIMKIMEEAKAGSDGYFTNLSSLKE